MLTPEEVIQPSSTCLLFPVLHSALHQHNNLDIHIVEHMEGTDLGRELMSFGLFLFFSFYITGLALSWTHCHPGHPTLVPTQRERRTV